MHQKWWNQKTFHNWTELCQLCIVLFRFSKKSYMNVLLLKDGFTSHFEEQTASP